MKNILSFLFVIAAITKAGAQNDIEPVNTGVANFLTIPADARVLAMGGASVSLTDGNSIFHNGSGLLLGNVSKSGVTYTYTPWMQGNEPGHNLHSVSGYHIVDKRNAVYAGLRYYGYPRVPVVSEGLSNDEYICPAEWAIDLGYSRKISDNLALSASFRFIRSDMGNIHGAKSANAIAFDLDASYSGRLRLVKDAKWSAGLNLSNYGTKLKYLERSEELPTAARLGGSVYLPFHPDHKIVAAADVGYRFLPSGVQSASVGSGIEYTLINHLMFRGGYRYGNKDKGEWSYASAGVGFSYWKLRLGFAWLLAETEAPVNNTFSLSCGIGF